MLIFESDGESITNMATVKTIYRNDNYIMVRFIDGTNHVVGRYESEERAEEVIREMHRTASGDFILPKE